MSHECSSESGSTVADGAALKGRSGLMRLWLAGGYSLAGLRAAYRSEAAFRQVVLLCLHGIAGVIVTPAQQLMIHDIVEPKELQSAVRLTTSSRMLGLLLGPAVGGAMMLVLSPATAILINVFLFVPVIVWMGRTQYGGKKPGAARAIYEVGFWLSLLATDPVKARAALGQEY